MFWENLLSLYMYYYYYYFFFFFETENLLLTISSVICFVHFMDIEFKGLSTLNASVHIVD